MRGRVLEVAVDWRRGDSVSLPYDDVSFDTVVCRRGLQLLGDRGGAVREMRRVLAPGGRLAVAVPGPIERSPAFAALAGALERHVGAATAAAVRWLFSLPEPGDLHAVLAAAGFDGVRVLTTRNTTCLASVTEFLRRCTAGSPLGVASACMPADAKRRVVAELERELAPFAGARGLWITIEANTGVASR